MLPSRCRNGGALERPGICHRVADQPPDPGRTGCQLLRFPVRRRRCMLMKYMLDSEGDTLARPAVATINVRSLLAPLASVSKVRARAPLRLGFAGGGTDVSPFSDTFGGCVLNATIGMFAHCSIEVRSDRKVKFVALDYQQEFETDAGAALDNLGFLKLHKA